MQCNNPDNKLPWAFLKCSEVPKTGACRILVPLRYTILQKHKLNIEYRVPKMSYKIANERHIRNWGKFHKI